MVFVGVKVRFDFYFLFSFFAILVFISPVSKEVSSVFLRLDVKPSHLTKILLK